MYIHIHTFPELNSNCSSSDGLFFVSAACSG